MSVLCRATVRIVKSKNVVRDSVTITDYDERRKPFDGNVMISMPVTGECPFCDWICKSVKSSTFAMHLSRKHARELGRIVNPYKCSQCDKCFTARSHLNHHVANHHEIIMHNCPETNCTYQGKNKPSVITHYMRRHMSQVVERCDAIDGCVSCDRTGDISVYHMGICHPASPFSK